MMTAWQPELLAAIVVVMVVRKGQAVEAVVVVVHKGQAVEVAVVVVGVRKGQAVQEEGVRA